MHACILADAVQPIDDEYDLVRFGGLLQHGVEGLSNLGTRVFRYGISRTFQERKDLGFACWGLGHSVYLNQSQV